MCHFSYFTFYLSLFQTQETEGTDQFTQVLHMRNKSLIIAYIQLLNNNFKIRFESHFGFNYVRKFKTLASKFKKYLDQ